MLRIICLIVCCAFLLYSCRKEEEESSVVVEGPGSPLIMGDLSAVSNIKEVNQTLSISSYTSEKLQFDIDEDGSEDIYFEKRGTHTLGGGDFFTITIEALNAYVAIHSIDLLDTTYLRVGNDTTIGQDSVVRISDYYYLSCSFIESADSVNVKKEYIPIYSSVGETIGNFSEFYSKRMILEFENQGGSGWFNNTGDTLWTWSNIGKSCHTIPEGQFYIGFELSNYVVPIYGWIKVNRDATWFTIEEFALQ